MIEMHMALCALRRMALAATQQDLDAARMDAADVLDQAGWEKSARNVIDSIGVPIAPANGEEIPSE